VVARDAHARVGRNHAHHALAPRRPWRPRLGSQQRLGCSLRFIPPVQVQLIPFNQRLRIETL
jgi:hypothetical protein